MRLLFFHKNIYTSRRDGSEEIVCRCDLAFQRSEQGFIPTIIYKTEDNLVGI